MNDWKKNGSVPSKKEDFLGYEKCYPTKNCGIVCEKCALHDKYTYGSGESNKAELDHFLTRLLYESCIRRTNSLSGNILEYGLYILAAEVLSKGKESDDTTKTANECLNKYKEKIMTKKESSSEYVNAVKIAAKNMAKPMETVVLLSRKLPMTTLR